MKNDDTSYGDQDDDDDLRRLDPDQDDMPAVLRLYDGEQVWIDGEPATLVAGPPVWYGDARRALERLDDARGEQ